MCVGKHNLVSNVNCDRQHLTQLLCKSILQKSNCSENRSYLLLLFVAVFLKTPFTVLPVGFGCECSSLFLLRTHLTYLYFLMQI